MTQIVTIPGQGEAEFPDNYTPEQIMGAIRKTFPVLDEKAKKAVPGSAQSQPDQPQQEPSLADRFKQAAMAPVGIVDAALTTGAGAVAQAGSTLGAIAGQIATGGLGDPAAARRASESAADTAARLTPAPLTEAGKSTLETVSGALEESKLGGVAPEAPLAVRGAKAASAAAQQARPAVAEAAGSTGRAVAAGVSKVADVAAGALTPMPEARVAALAKKAVDLGIPLRPDQLSSNKIARMVGEALEKVPLSGSKAKQRQIGFNRALGSLIGAEESDHLTPDVYSRAMEKSGERIGEIAAETPIRVDPDFIATLDARQAALSKETRDARLAVRGYINDLKEAGKDGVIDGTQFRKINSDLGAQIRRTSDGDLRHALTELQADLHDVMEKNIANPEKLKEFQDVKKKYAIGLTLEPLVAKATTTGDISPGGLLGRVTADRAGKRRMARGQGGELGDLAEIGKLFLKEPDSSGTAERALAYAGIGGAGYIDPHTAAGVVAGANVYNRLGPRMVKRALRDVEAKKSDARPKRRQSKKEQEKQYLLRDALEVPSDVEQTPLRKAVGE